MRKWPWLAVAIGAFNLALRLGGYQNALLARLLWIVFAFALVLGLIWHEITRHTWNKCKVWTARVPGMQSFVAFIGFGAGLGAIGGLLVWLIIKSPIQAKPPVVINPPSQAPPPSSAPTKTETDAHEQLASGKLVRGWTLHKRGNVFSIYLIMNTDQLNAPMINAIDQTDLLPTADQSVRISALWSDIHLSVPQPEPVRTEYGIVEGQEFVEHVAHYIQEPDAVTWTYEVMKNGSGITPHPQVFKNISLADLSSDSRKTISELDALAVRTVNRRYIEAMVKISK